MFNAAGMDHPFVQRLYSVHALSHQRTIKTVTRMRALWATVFSGIMSPPAIVVRPNNALPAVLAHAKRVF
jgi:hypothetical protein